MFSMSYIILFRVFSYCNNYYKPHYSIYNVVPERIVCTWVYISICPCDSKLFLGCWMLEHPFKDFSIRRGMNRPRVEHMWWIVLYVILLAAKEYISWNNDDMSHFERKGKFFYMKAEYSVNEILDYDDFERKLWWK